MTKIWPSISAAIAHSAHKAHAPLTWDPAGHVLSRFSFGPTKGDRSYLAKHGVTAWYNAQVAFGKKHPGYSGHKSIEARGPLLRMSPYDVREWLKRHGNEYDWTAMDQLTEVTIGLQTWSSGQLYETLVDFFANHLNVPNHNDEVWNTRHDFDRTVTRRYAMGRFSDMLLASARHPAMLTYLSLAESTKAAVNENYGRELLELHTVGLHYSENDVTNTAKMLTGRTVDDHQHYLFDGYIHPRGRVKVLGFTNANSSAERGEAAGDALLRYLAHHRFTANNIARKLCVRFVSDNPSNALVNAVASSYLKNDTKILPMVSTILRSTEFWESRGAKIRRPTENVIATIRTLNPAVSSWDKALQSLHWITNSMGNCPLDWPAPDGYPDVATAWRSAGNLMTEWNLHLGFAGGWWDGMKAPSINGLYAGKPSTSGEAVTLLTRRLTGMKFSAAHHAALQGFLDEPASTPISHSRLQWLAYPLVALILDGPHHALR
jgi:Protein of unknown function (DUF1800)